ncbi:MAG: zinc ribbon domain-containing protein [Desulfomonile sp.]|nr:zinc ribbon domain-containing protein [Desulfomonile sp.]
MPITRYRCRSCGKEFVKIFFEPENAPRACTVCGAVDLEDMGPAFDATARPRFACASCISCGPEGSCPTEPK